MPNSRPVRVCRLLFRGLPLGLAAALLIGGVAVNMANVIGRYFFQNAIYWAEEAMIYMAIWSIFLASVAIAYDQAHLTMDAFATHLSQRLRRLAEGIIAAVTVTICLFMALQSLTLVRTLIRNGQNSIALELPMAIPQSSLMIGFTLISAAVITRFVLRLNDEEHKTASSERAAP